MRTSQLDFLNCRLEFGILNIKCIRVECRVDSTLGAFDSIRLEVHLIRLVIAYKKLKCMNVLYLLWNRIRVKSS
jgi:hypothetical protein